MKPGVFIFSLFLVPKNTKATLKFNLFLIIEAWWSAKKYILHPLEE